MRISSAIRIPFLVRPSVVFLLCICLLPAFGQDSRKIISRVAPVYPPAAKSMHISGQVHVDATVSPDGQVAKAKATSGHPMLAAAAQSAVERWKFAPGPETTVVPVIVNFQPSE